jgi:D-sedoheptulose 7-phosphate isomerase
MLDVTSHILALPHLMIARAAIMILQHAQRGSNIWLIGNGGSFSNAEHIALDLTHTGRIPHVYSPPSPPMLTAFANDGDFELVFVDWLASRARTGDLLIALSCSKTSTNIMHACQGASARQIAIVGLWGRPMHEGADRYADLNIYVDSDDYRTIETCHLAIGQWWSAILADIGKAI